MEVDLRNLKEYLVVSVAGYCATNMRVLIWCQQIFYFFKVAFSFRMIPNIRSQNASSIISTIIIVCEFFFSMTSDNVLEVGESM